MPLTSSSSAAVASICGMLQRLQSVPFTTAASADQWVADYQLLSRHFQLQWSVFAVANDISSLSVDDLQLLCSSWWVFVFLKSPRDSDEDNLACTLSFLRASQPLLLLSIPEEMDEAHRTALQSAASEALVLWDSAVRDVQERTAVRLADSSSLLPPWRAVSHLCVIETILVETALTLPHETGTTQVCDEQFSTPFRRETLLGIQQSLKSACSRLVSTHVHRVSQAMLYPAFHPVAWQVDRVLESSMARVAGVHPCVWMFFYLCRLCVCHARAQDTASRPLNDAAAMFVLEYCHAFLALIENCIAYPVEAWQEDATRRHAFLTDVYVAAFLCRLLRGICAPVEGTFSQRDRTLEDTLLGVVASAEAMDRCCHDTEIHGGRESAPAAADPFSQSDVWQRDVWSVAPLTVVHIAGASSKAPWSASFVAAGAMTSLLDARAALVPATV